MAFVTKYTVEQKNKESGSIWYAHIQEDGASFIADLPPAVTPIAIEWRTNNKNPDWCISSSVATVRFVDDTTGLLSSIFNGGTDERYKLLITEDEGGGEVTNWEGFIDPESYSFGYLNNGVGSIQATDRIGKLKTEAYANAGTPYTGSARIIDIIAQCLEKTGLGLGIATHSRRYSYLATNPLTTANDPLYYHEVRDQSVYLDASGNPFSCFDVLKDVCTAWGLQIFQAPIGNPSSRWLVLERRRDVFDGFPGRFYTYNKYTSAGAKDTPATGSVATEFEVSVEGVSTYKFSDAVMSAELPIGQASVIYNHGKLGDQWQNLGFDEGIVGWTASTGNFFADYRVNNVLTSTTSLTVPVAFSTTPATATVQSINQTALSNISGATNYKIRLSFYTRAPELVTGPEGPLPAGNEFNFYWSMKLGGSYWRLSDNSWQTIGGLTDQQILNVYPIHTKNTNETQWFEFNQTSAVITGLSGALKFEMREAVEEDNTVDTFTQATFLVDSVTLELLDNNDQLIKTSRQTTATVSGSTNSPGDVYNTLIGSGPLDIFSGSMIQRDSTDAVIGGATDWDYDVPGAATGKSLDQVGVDERINAYSEPSRTVTGAILSTAISSTIDLRPQQQIVIERPDSTTKDVYMWASSFKWYPADMTPANAAQWTQVQTLSPTLIHTVVNIDKDAQQTGVGSFTTIVSVSGVGAVDVVDDTTELEGLTVGDVKSAVVMQSHADTEDLGAGVFIKDSTDASTTVNNITVFASNDGKRIKRAITEMAWPVEWAGTLGDGTTNDAVALQDMIDAAPGREVYLPAGRYVTNTSIVIDAQAMTIRGGTSSYYKDDGRASFPVTPTGAVIIAGPSLTGPVFIVQDTTTGLEEFNPVRFENLHFIGNGTTDTSAIDIRGAFNCQVVNCNVTGFSSHGVEVSTAPTGLTRQSATILVNGCTFENNTGFGLRVECLDSKFINNIFTNNTGGGFLEAETSFGNIVAGNIAAGNGAHGISIFGTGSDVISNNTSNGNGGRGIYAGHTSLNVSHTITGNNCFFNGTDAGLGNDERAGMVLNQIHNSVVTGNVLSFNQTYGLFVFGLKNVRLAGNSGGNNTIAYSNTRTQNITGRYNALEYGVLQADNAADLLLQELIDEMPAGAVLEVPVGDYSITNILTASKAITLRGQATREATGTLGTRFIADSGLTGAMIAVTAAGVNIENINFIGDAGQPVGANAIDCTGNNCVIKNSVITGFTSTGIVVQPGADGVTIKDVTCIGNGDKGIFVQGSDISIDRCTIKDNGTVGILATGCTELTVTRCIVSGNGTSGVNLQTGFHNIVSDCQIKENQFQGVKIRSGDNYSIHGNNIVNNGKDTGATTVERAGVYIEEGNKHRVTGNYIGDSQGTATQLHAIATGPLLASATILENTGAGNVTAFYNLNATTAGDLDIDLDHTETINLASLGAGASIQHTVTITGARAGDKVKLGPPSNFSLDIIIGNGVVTAEDTLKIPFHNPTGGAIDAASGDWKIGLERREGATASIPAPTGLNQLVKIQFTNYNLLQQA